MQTKPITEYNSLLTSRENYLLALRISKSIKCFKLNSSSSPK
jgi:hypothetical protein